MHFSRSPFIALAVTATIGRFLQLRDLADLAHRLDAVHLRHHDVHQHDVDVRLVLQDADRVAAVVGRDDRHVVLLQHASTGRRCCACRRPRSAPSCRPATLVRLVQVARAPAAAPRAAWPRRGAGRSAVWSSSRSGEWTPAHGAGIAPAAASRPSSARRCRRRRRSTGSRRARPLASASSASAPASQVRQRRVDDHAVDAAARAAAAARPRPSADGGHLRRPRPPTQLADCGRAGPASGSTTSSCRAGRPTKSLQLVEQLVERRRGSGSAWRRRPGAPDASARSRASSVEMTHTGMCRVAEVVLQPLQHPPAVDVRQVDVERDGVGLVLAGQGQGRRRPSEVTSPLKPFSRAASSRKRAKPRSFSTISSTRSPGWMSSRSSPTSLTRTSAGSDSGAGGLGRALAGRSSARRRPGARRRSAAAADGRRRRLGLARGRDGGVRLRQVQRERAAAGRACSTSRISPPSSRDSSRLMARPRPVPPYLRLVRPSACWNASKMICCLSAGCRCRCR